MREIWSDLMFGKDCSTSSVKKLETIVVIQAGVWTRKMTVETGKGGGSERYLD